MKEPSISLEREDPLSRFEPKFCWTVDYLIRLLSSNVSSSTILIIKKF